MCKSKKSMNSLVNEVSFQIDLLDVIDKNDLNGFKRNIQLFSHAFSANQCYLSIASKENVIMVVYYEPINLITKSSSYDSILLEFPALSSGSVSAQMWLPHGMLFIGFESGYLMIFSKEGICLHECRYFESSVQSIQFVKQENVATYTIWVLYEQGYMSAFSLEVTSDGVAVGQTLKYKLIDHSSVNDFSIAKTTMKFGLTSDTPSDAVSIYVSGQNASLSSYNVGCPQQFEHIGKLGSYVKEKVIHVFSRTIRSFFDTIKPTGNNVKATSTKDYDQPVASVLDLKDPKRRIIRLLMDNKGDTIAMADSLGRVLLYDVRMNCVIRMWKGVRDARLAWCQNSPNPDNPYEFSTCLVIYAPLIGIASVYGMRHGPLLRTIPIGIQCHIFSGSAYMPFNSNVTFVVKFNDRGIVLEALNLSNYTKLISSSHLDSFTSEWQQELPEQEPSSHMQLSEECFSLGSDKLSSYGIEDIPFLDNEILSWLHNSSETDARAIKKVVCIIKKLELTICSRMAFPTPNTSSKTNAIVINSNVGFSLELHREIFEYSDRMKVYDPSVVKRRKTELDAYSMLLNIRNINTKNPLFEDDIDIPVNNDVVYQKRSEVFWYLTTTSPSTEPCQSQKSFQARTTSFYGFIALLGSKSKHSEELSFNVEELVRIANQSSIVAARDTYEENMLDIASDNAIFESFDVRDFHHSVAKDIRNLLVEPLFGDDVFILNSYQQAVRLLSPSTCISFRNICQLFAAELNEKSNKSIKLTLSKQASSSTFQRWFRDNLLAIQGVFSTLCTSNMTIDDLLASFDYHSHDETLEADEDMKANDASYILTNVKAVNDLNGTTTLSLVDFDAFIRLCLNPTYALIVRSKNLEAMMALVALILESLTTVNEQLERRTYNACTLRKTIESWEELFCKLRLLLVLSRRRLIGDSSNKDVVIMNLENGNINIYQCLATDTLCFLTDAEKCQLHESRCFEVTHKTKALELSNRQEPTHWWGYYNAVWKEIASLCEPDVNQRSLSTDSRSSNKDITNDSSKKKMRPVLLYFPHHNIPLNLTAHRALILAERWSKAPQNIILLTQLISHLRSLSSKYLISVITAKIIRYDAIPNILLNCCCIDEDPGLLHDSPRVVVEFMGMFANPSFVFDFTSCLMQLVDTYSSKQEPQETDINDDTHAPVVWPPLKDKLLNDLAEEHTKTLLTKSNFFDIMAAEMSSFLMTTQLRVLCRLRHIKLISVLNDKWFFRRDHNDIIHEIASNFQIIQEKLLKRTEFLKLCLRFLSNPMPGNHHLQTVFRLGEFWSIPKDTLLQYYLAALIEKGTCDHLVEDVVRQINDTSSCVNILLCGLRLRFGLAFVNIERFPKYVSILSMIDADTIAWVKGFNNATDLSTIESRNNGNIDFNVKSTRQLVVLLQLLLQSNRFSNEASVGLLEKKIKCDSMLALCDCFVNVM